jgi:hypothetical protein
LRAKPLGRKREKILTDDAAKFMPRQSKKADPDVANDWLRKIKESLKEK